MYHIADAHHGKKKLLKKYGFGAKKKLIIIITKPK
jgi:hypothetical protein